MKMAAYSQLPNVREEKLLVRKVETAQARLLLNSRLHFFMICINLAEASNIYFV